MRLQFDVVRSTQSSHVLAVFEGWTQRQFPNMHLLEAAIQGDWVKSIDEMWKFYFEELVGDLVDTAPSQMVA